MKLALATICANRREFIETSAAVAGLSLALWAASWAYPLGFIGHVWSAFQ